MKIYNSPLKMMLSLFFILTLPLLGLGQTRLFVEPDFNNIARDHKIIAVLPFQTTISLRPKQMQQIGSDDLARMEKSESLDIQRAMYSWFLKRRQQGDMWVDVQDINTSNALLKRNGIEYENLQDFTADQLAEVLNVDAVILGSFSTNKPMSEGAAVAVAVIFGVYGSTNNAVINMFIHNRTDGKVLVNYNKGVSGSLGSNPDQLINIIMRKASRRIPYTKPKA